MTIKEVSKLLKSATPALARNVWKACERKKRKEVSVIASKNSSSEDEA